MLLIRPDGYVGLVTKDKAPTPIASYLQTCLPQAQ
ncbi:hypothetical protein [Dyella flava]